MVLPWLMRFTRGGDSRQRDTAQEASDEEKLERASSVCSHAGGVESGSTQPAGRATINGKREDVEHAGGQVPLRRPRRRVRGGGGGSADECHRGGRWKCSPTAPARRVLSTPPRCSSTSSAPAAPSKDGQRFSHLQSIIHTDTGSEKFGRGITAFWRTIVDGPDAFPPEF